MTQLSYGDVADRLRGSCSGKQMPFLYAVNRAYAFSEDIKQKTKGIHSQVFDMNQYGGNEDYLTCMSISQENGIIAMGSGNKAGNLYFVQDSSAIKDVELGSMRFKPVHKQSLGMPIHSLDWSKNRILIGSRQGIVKLCTVNIQEGSSFQGFNLVGQYVNSPSEIVHYAPSYTINTQVKAVEFCPVQDQFLSTTINQLAIWDTTQESAPIHRYSSLHQAPLNCASWSPHQSLIVCGGYDRKLVIIDTRTSDGVAWSADKAHDRPIQDAKFNPFIPYWLASAGEDSVVNIWDIRATQHSPVAKVDGNVGTVNSITWSNVRPENIGTATSDGFMRFWTLSPESFPIWDTHYRITHYSNQDTLPIVRERDQDNIWCIKDQNYRYGDTRSWRTNVWKEDVVDQDKRSAILLAGALRLGQWGKQDSGLKYKGEESVQARGPVVSVKTSALRPSTYYSITSGGQLTAHMVRFDTESNLRSRHRFDPEDKNEIAAQIEDDIYCRRITNAQSKLDYLKSMSTSDEQAEQQRLEEVSFLEDCLLTREPIKETDWQFDSIPDISSRRFSQRSWKDQDIYQCAIDQFKSDLKYWSYCIPPGYNRQYKFPLEFKDPIIAAHLTEKEERPPLTKDHLSYESSALSIKERRNMNHVPSIVTSDTQPLKQRDVPFTPPYSGISQNPDILTSKNPFQTSSPERVTPPLKEEPQNTNPFEQELPQEQQSTNPFESTTTFERKESHNWMSSSHHLSLSFSRHSTSEDSIKSHHSKFNPFRKIKSYRLNKDEAGDVPSLKRESSSANRRNALHGPF